MGVHVVSVNKKIENSDYTSDRVTNDVCHWETDQSYSSEHYRLSRWSFVVDIQSLIAGSFKNNPSNFIVRLSRVTCSHEPEFVILIVKWLQFCSLEIMTDSQHGFL